LRKGIREYLLSKAPSSIGLLTPGDVLLGIRDAEAEDVGFEQRILDILDEQAKLLMDGDVELGSVAEVVTAAFRAEVGGIDPTEGSRGLLRSMAISQKEILKLLEDWRTEATRTRPYYLSLPVWPSFAVPNNRIDGLLPSCRVESWAHFVEVVRDRDHNRAKLEMVYRGQRGFSWPLSPTLARNFPNGVIRETDRDMLLENFRLAMRGRGPDLTSIDESEVWAYGQHVGLATPLLDWSKSPFVSLYFAFSEPDPEGEDNPSRAVYCLDLTRLKAELPELFLEPRSNDNSRLVNQAGLFTLTPAGRESLESYIINALEKSSAVDFDGFVDLPTDENSFEFPDDETAKRLSSYLCKIHIPNEKRDDCLAMLRKMNIHHGSLFPDPFGAAQYCNDWLQRSIREDEEEALLKRQQDESAKRTAQEASKIASRTQSDVSPELDSGSVHERILQTLEVGLNDIQVELNLEESAIKIIKNYRENESIDWVLKESSKARIRTELARQLGLLGAGSAAKKLASEFTMIFEDDYRSKHSLEFDKSLKSKSFFSGTTE
jgi:hypothetical protein